MADHHWDNEIQKYIFWIVFQTWLEANVMILIEE